MGPLKCCTNSSATSWSTPKFVRPIAAIAPGSSASGRSSWNRSKARSTASGPLEPPPAPKEKWDRRFRLSTCWSRRFLYGFLLPRLRHNVNKRRLALLHALQSALVGCGQILRVRDRPLSVHSVGLRHLGVVDVRIDQLRPDVRVLCAPIMQAALPLHEHHF